MTRKTPPAPGPDEKWKDNLRYIEADVNDRSQDAKWAGELDKHKGVVSCLGAFATSQQEMSRVRHYTTQNRLIHICIVCFLTIYCCVCWLCFLLSSISLAS